MALKLSSDLKNYIINAAIIKQLCGTLGTGGTGQIIIYSGSQPTDADQATNGSALCYIGGTAGLGVGWGGTGGANTTTGATAGTAGIASTAGYVGTAINTGIAGWARFQCFGTNFLGTAATFRLDGDVGTASTCVFVINSTSIVAGALVTLLAAPISFP